MKGNVSCAWLLIAASCLNACGGGESSNLTPVVSNEEPPAFISYPDPNAFTQGVPITPLVPTITGGTPTTYVVQPDLPAGLRIDFQGRILGTPTQATAPNTYIVTAGNTAGTTSFGVRITVTGTYTVGGSVSGLATPGLVLTNNGDHALTVDNNGSFTLPGAFTAGYSFLVEVATQPPGQSCTVSGGSGVITNSNYVNTVVTCSANVQKLASTFTEAVQEVANRSRRDTYLACSDVMALRSLRVIDPRTRTLRLLGDVLDESAPTCGRYSIAVDPTGTWVYVTNTVTDVVTMYAR
jgi:hypothetical protein